MINDVKENINKVAEEQTAALEEEKLHHHEELEKSVVEAVADCNLRIQKLGVEIQKRNDEFVMAYKEQVKKLEIQDIELASKIQKTKAVIPKVKKELAERITKLSYNPSNIQHQPFLK